MIPRAPQPLGEGVPPAEERGPGPPGRHLPLAPPHDPLGRRAEGVVLLRIGFGAHCANFAQRVVADEAHLGPQSVHALLQGAASGDLPGDKGAPLRYHEAAHARWERGLRHGPPRGRRGERRSHVARCMAAGGRGQRGPRGPRGLRRLLPLGGDPHKLAGNLDRFDAAVAQQSLVGWQLLAAVQLKDPLFRNTKLSAEEAVPAAAFPLALQELSR
mmetsp:Transcript_39478/g.93662  ORF Transcript_39478/g.93662 Transcript_39478/m.93662 type:complete len:215 (+) Transcript_39478:492-1136(+)